MQIWLDAGSSKGKVESSAGCSWRVVQWLLEVKKFPSLKKLWSTKYVWMCSSSPSPQSFLSLKQAHIWNYFGERGELRTWQKFKKGCEMQALNKNDSWGNFCVLGNIKLSTKVVCTEVWELVVTSFPNIFGNLPILPWINLGTLN